MSIAHSHPETEERPGPSPEFSMVNDTPPTNAALRAKIQALIDAGESQTDIAKGARVNRSILSQWLDDKDPGNSSKWEANLAGWLARRGLETLSFIPTIETGVSKQIAIAARMVRDGRIMGKCIGRSGIGKSRGSAVVAGADPGGVIAFSVTQVTGKREALRVKLMEAMGIQGPTKRAAGGRSAAMDAELHKRLTGTDILILIDEAHRLTKSGQNYLMEIWNETHAPQLWLGTDELVERVDRDEQIGSRLEYTLYLTTEDPEGVIPPAALVKHLINSRLPEVNGDLAELLPLCVNLAISGNYRRVENRLISIEGLRKLPKNAGKSWTELFKLAGGFLPAGGGAA